MLSRPDSLNVRVVTISEKAPFSPLIDGQENVSGRLTKIQKSADLIGKRPTVLGQFANLRA
jgi:hypothetical protein